MTHLSSDEIVDAAAGTLDESRQRHLEDCEPCRSAVATLRAVLTAAPSEPVPEPSPLFWAHFSARVREAIDAEARAGVRGWRDWMRWQAAIPLGALAAVLLAVVASLSRPPAEQVPIEAVQSAASAAELDATGLEPDRWRALADMVGPLDWDAASEAGLGVVPGDAERAALELDTEERRELTVLLASELAREKS
jgi:hypothetical protein